MKAEELLTHGGIKPTANRILVVRALQNSGAPMSMTDLESELDPMEKSSIFRVLTLLLKHSMVHAIEDGRGIAKYELCNGGHNGNEHDMHAHFYCENCQRVTCFESIQAPMPDLPEGFEIRSVNYMLKGICDRCAGSHQAK
ncbi:MAG: transcriptional repressor [Muribaculaceae bacterium]|nr:transcriptional repressor [Muribaculaceae bacterium]